LKKTTYEIYKNLLPKSFLFFSVSANLFSAVDKCAIFSNSAKEISVLQTLRCAGIVFNHRLDKNLSFLESKDTLSQNPFLVWKQILLPFV